MLTMLSCKQYNSGSHGIKWQYMRTSAVMKAFWSTFELQQLFDLIVMPVACDVYFAAALSTCLFSLTTTYTTHTE